MANKEDNVYLIHILKCIKRIEEYTRLKSEDDFKEAFMMQDAVIRQIEIIGEAANKLSKIFPRSNSQINWSEIVGMRHKLIHDYFDVDPTVVWMKVQQDIPPLKNEILKILRTYKS